MGQTQCFSEMMLASLMELHTLPRASPHLALAVALLWTQSSKALWKVKQED
jgi:hypothetical protein